MTEERGPKRLLGEDDPLLAAAREDAPPGDLESRILAGMGGPPPPATSGSGGGKLLWKLGLAGVVGAGAALWLTRGTPAPAPPVVEPPSTIVTSAAAPIEPPPTPIEEAHVEKVEAPVRSAQPSTTIATRPRASVAAVTPAPSASAAPALGLGAEIKALDGVRASMNGGDANGALTALDAYDHAFPQGTLKQEAVLLRIDALMRAGRSDDARKLGHAFLAEHPSTPHRKRILTLLREGD